MMVGKRTVAMLMQRTDGTWFARLECHLPIEAPVVIRNCTSFDTGKAGIEVGEKNAMAGRSVELPCMRKIAIAVPVVVTTYLTT